MAITAVKPVVVLLNDITAETTDTDFVAVDATAGAYFDMDARDENFMIGFKNDVAVDDYYEECASDATGAISVKASGASGASEIDYNAETLVKADGTALYAEAPTGKYVKKISGTKTATIKAGDGLNKILGDLTISLAPNTIAWSCIESSRFKVKAGDNKGRVLITGTDAHVLVKVLKRRLSN